jgi:hypothetical protein
MGGPLEGLAAEPYPVLAVLLGMLIVSGQVMMQIAKRHLVNDDIQKPFKVLESAETEKEMRRISASWGDRGVREAKHALAMDVPFLIAYGAGLSLLCSLGAVYFADHDAEPAAWVWTVGAWLALIAALCDAVENVLLWRMLNDRINKTTLSVRAMVTKVKWALALGVTTALAIPALAFDLVA